MRGHGQISPRWQAQSHVELYGEQPQAHLLRPLLLGAPAAPFNDLTFVHVRLPLCQCLPSSLQPRRKALLAVRIRVAGTRSTTRAMTTTRSRSSGSSRRPLS